MKHDRRFLFASLLFFALVAALPGQGGDQENRPPKPGPGPAPGPGGKAFTGGPTAPDGTRIRCELPGNLHRENTSSKGLGNCVFTSIHHSAVWQNVPALQEFPQWLIRKGIPGGGVPSKVDDLIPRMCRERGMPVPDYVQIEDRDLEVLKLACRCGRMPGVTYSRSPTGRYGGQVIAHMVNVVHADDRWFVVLDNNYPGEDAYEWMSPRDFLRTYVHPQETAGWSVILLAPPPPPPLVIPQKKE